MKLFKNAVKWGRRGAHAMGIGGRVNRFLIYLEWGGWKESLLIYRITSLRSKKIAHQMQGPEKTFVVPFWLFST
jgi:hypothetical protein